VIRGWLPQRAGVARPERRWGCRRGIPAKTSGLRPKPQGRGQSYEVEAICWRLRPRPRPKIIMKKYQIMINNIRFTIIAGKN